MPARRPAEVLKEAGVEVVLVNSNPATIMTDGHMADHVYIEPLTLPTLRRIIEKEQPDSILPTLGGQTGLTLAMQLAKEGFLEEHGVKLLGANAGHHQQGGGPPDASRTPWRQSASPSSPPMVTESVEGALAFAAKRSAIRVIVRPAFTLGGSGGGIADRRGRAQGNRGARACTCRRIHQMLVEKCIAGWKEIEFEVMRDSRGQLHHRLLHGKLRSRGRAHRRFHRRRARR